MSFNRKEQRAIRHARVRRRVNGTAERPRMAINVSNKHMYVQFIDDRAMNTLASATTLKKGESRPCNLETAKWLGEQAAGVAKDKGISIVVVDRGGFKFHGRVKQIVESAVAAGLKISDKGAEETKE
ncbi:MAG: 50S ribosomal protein L18 [Kiritimatiellae bacterium]|nr:50S ribosomal protein L18 [Kiritimatiellia bacterium]